MPERNPQLDFLLRASGLLIVFLAIWWLALQPPLLGLLRVSESLALRLVVNADPDPIAVDAAGDWNFRIPVEDTAVQHTQVKFKSIEFTMAKADAVLFTFSLPVLWAIALAGTPGKSAIRAVLWGTGLMLVVEILSLLLEVEITAYAALAQLHGAAGGAGSGFGAWFRDFADRLIVGVVPFAAPIVAAVALHRELRMQVFG